MPCCGVLQLKLKECVRGDLQGESCGPCSAVFLPKTAKADDNYGELVSLSTAILICLFAGLEDILLINSKCSSNKTTTLQTVKLPRSSVLDRVQSFLPQMAQANDELKRKMVTAPAHQFDIEHLDSETEKVIEMNVAVVELSDSDTDEELLTSEDDSESDEDDAVTDEVTIDNIKFPKQKGEKGKIEILDSKENE
ncbi:PREDICTED: uncharacterized protein C12orf45 homolog [Corvus brachyrhynchos]|uniref:uncharacterized protein C12orf45 homolog n=1 Tax=Corvus brachyrhynchos TaxID=85066 RepID=UPI00081644EE|nr:PREDICTED: uncharacterized protein C12orf45 homolog [Corvus brachyrhynchos]